jgi:uncharacterized membrane protein
MDNTSNITIPPAHPNAGDAYSNGWQIMKKYFLELLLLAFIGFLIEIPMGWPFRGDYEEWDQYMNFSDRIFPLAYWILLAVPLEYGITLLYLRAVRGEKIVFRELITGFNQFIDVIFSRILVIGIVAIGFFLLIIPGIVFAIKLSLVPYLVMDKKLDAIAAVKESWRLTNGYGWTIFGMVILAIPIFIGGLIAMIVGVIIAAIWVQCAFASLYYAISSNTQSENAGVAPEVVEPEE